MRNKKLKLHVFDSDATGLMRGIQRELTSRFELFEKGESIDCENAETIDVVNPCVVLAPMPEPLKDGSSLAADYLLDCPAIRFVLSHPDVLVVCVTPLMRSSLEREITKWVRHSRFCSEKPSEEFIAKRIGEFVDNAPLRWSFLTADEFEGDGLDRLALFADVISQLAAEAIYDPTGLRTLLKSLFTGCLQVTDGSAGPWFAAVVDDDSEAAHRHAYYARRLGYNPLVVDSASLYDLAFDETKAHDYGSEYKKDSFGKSLWFGNHEPDLLLVDKLLAFAGKNERGDKLLGTDESPGRVSAKKGALVSNESSVGESRQINKPVIGVHDLSMRYKEKTSDDIRTGKVLEQNAFAAHHHRFLKHLRAIGNSLLTQAEKAPTGIKKSLFWLETHELLRGFDGPMSAMACLRMQQQEAREVCENYVPRERNMLKGRLDEIDRMIDEAFGEGSFNVVKVHWRVRILRIFLRVADEKGMPQWVRDRVTSAILAAEQELQALEDPARARKLRLLYGALEWFNSWRMVLKSWIALLFAFILLYVVLGVVKIVVSGGDVWSYLLLVPKSIAASLAGGFAFGVGQELSLDIWGLGPYIGLLHSLLAMILLARLVHLVYMQTQK